MLSDECVKNTVGGLMVSGECTCGRVHHQLILQTPQEVVRAPYCQVNVLAINRIPMLCNKCVCGSLLGELLPNNTRTPMGPQCTFIMGKSMGHLLSNISHDGLAAGKK